MAETREIPGNFPGEAAGATLKLGAAPAGEDIAALRALLFQREIDFIEDLQKHLGDPATQARDTSSVIAEALLLRAGKDDRLNFALRPVVESIFRDFLRKKPQDFTNALFPLMGPAIRKSIAETFRSMLGSFNKSMEMAFSWKGLRWRLEGWRTGKPFSEIVLLHTLVYRVEQVFFIHSETGLEIAHVVNEGVESQDAGMVSAMLTAIQDFVRDCFISGKDGDLESFQHGEYTFLVEKDARAYIACMVRGTPPADFRERMRGVLETMLIEYAEPLEEFSGDTTPFLGVQRHLEELLASRYVDQDKPLSFMAKALPFLILLVIVGAFAFMEYRSGLAEKAAVLAADTVAQAVEEARQAHETRMENGLELLRDEPGLMVIHVKAQDMDPWEVLVLRDDLAPPPESVLENAGQNPACYDLSVLPFVSYERSIVTRRVRDKIHPPESVTTRFGDDGVLYFSGTAPMNWILSARQEALFLPGVRGVNMEGLADPRSERLSAMVSEVEGTVVEFVLGRDVPVAEDAPKLKKAVDTLAELEKLASEMGVAVSLTVYGHADTTGNEKRNYEISQERAKVIAAMLYSRGSSIPITTYGMGAEFARTDSGGGGENQASRRIELRVHLARAGSVPPVVLE